MPTLSRDEDLFVLNLGDGENRFSNAFIADMHAHLDEVEAGAADAQAGLIVTASGKFWSNGIDLDALATASPEDQSTFLPALNALLGRLVRFPLPTAAALNGHAFAGGALLAFTFDYRVMRQDRGWMCLPEVDIEIPFHPAMLALLQAKLAPNVLRDAVLSGRRYTAPEAQAAGLIDATAPLDELTAVAGRLLEATRTKKRGIFGKMKAGLYGDLAQQFGYTDVP